MKEIMHEQVSANKDTMFQNTTLEVRKSLDLMCIQSHNALLARVRRMYDELSKRQASVLAQLRTGMTPLNGYLHNIKAVESNLCECGEAVESREHFIFCYTRWSEQREILGVWAGEEDLSRLLGGETTTDTDDWAPDMDAVRAVIHFTLATKRFEHDSNERIRVTR